MSAHLFDVPKLHSSPPRPKHQVTRSITEVSTLSVQQTHKSHHHHPHLHWREKEPQSAHPNLEPHESGTKSEGVTPEEGKASSIGMSVLGDTGWEKNERVVRNGEVREEMERGVLRAIELRNAITGLNTLSNNTTRRLDNTYYSVLENLSVLRNTIMSMKELASMTRQLKEGFKTESEEVVADVEMQLDAFGGFEHQQKRIEELQKRVMTGREQVKSLGGRVDVVREKVEGWQKAEGEWQERTRKRLRILWILIAFFAALLLALVGLRYTPARTQVDMLKGVNTSSLAEVLPDFERIVNKSQSVTKPGLNVLEELLQKDDEEGLGEDPRLRIFDEL